MRALLVTLLVLSSSATALADEPMVGLDPAEQAEDAEPLPALELPPKARGFEQVGAFITSGKAELIATSTLLGGYLATVALVDAGFLITQVGQVSLPGELQPLILASFFITPIVGGAGGVALATLATALLPELSAGDANVLRASQFLATFNSAVSGLLVNGYGDRYLLDWWRLRGAASTTAMLAGAAGTLAGGAAVAAFTDLPEGAGPLGLSLGLWSGTLATLGQLMFELPLRFEDGTLLVGSVVNLGFGAGLLLSPFAPITRFETWLLDLGAVAGGLLGTAIVLGIPAPNPVLGYGGIATGVVLGAAAGVGLGKLVPLGLELVNLPTLVAVGPLVLPPSRSGQIPLGAQVSINVDGALEALLPGRLR